MSREAGIEIGDIVVPAEGWPPMAVVRIHVEVGEAQCIWKEDGHKMGRFPIRELTVYMSAIQQTRVPVERTSSS